MNYFLTRFTGVQGYQILFLFIAYRTITVKRKCFVHQIILLNCFMAKQSKQSLDLEKVELFINLNKFSGMKMMISFFREKQVYYSWKGSYFWNSTSPIEFTYSYSFCFLRFAIVVRCDCICLFDSFIFSCSLLSILLILAVCACSKGIHDFLLF